MFGQKGDRSAEIGGIYSARHVHWLANIRTVVERQPPPLGPLLPPYYSARDAAQERRQIAPLRVKGVGVVNQPDEEIMRHLRSFAAIAGEVKRKPKNCRIVHSIQHEERVAIARAEPLDKPGVRVAMGVHASYDDIAGEAAVSSRIIFTAETQRAQRKQS
jgi:hypothetical protein